MQGNPFTLAPEETANPLLSDSWFRSQLYGLQPTTDEFPRLRSGELADLLASHSGLQQLTQPVVGALSRKVADLQSVVILSDASGLVLQTFGNMHAMQKAQSFALAPGNLWSESGRGTNAIGTALAIDDSCEIDGRQHFLTSNQDLYCAAIPIQSPDGQIAGVLDISGPAHFPHPHTLGWVKEAAKQIEYLWVKQSLHPQQWLMSLHSQPQKLDSVEELLLVFSDNVLTAGNRLAMRELGLGSEQLGHITFQQLFPLLTQTAVTVPLPLTVRRQSYYYRLRAPTRSAVAVSAPPTVDLPFAGPREGEKMVRLLNAGIALCIEGETGCGKEYVSRTLHQHSRWRSGKFVAINCAAIPESLIESELFGYQPGAFTGASKNGYIGKIREADGGVLFLDEIGDMPMLLQTRLLRVLQEKEVTPLGASQSTPVNFAVICATHRNLAQRVADGEFREDLFYRLREFALAIPPLRGWPALPAFIQRLWQALGAGQRRVQLSPDLLDNLARQPWPGNVRQLQSLMKVLLALADDGARLEVDDLPAEYRAAPAPAAPRGLQQHDSQLIADTLTTYNGNVSKAAQALGVARSTLYRRAARSGRN
ncbi:MULTISPECIES: sigma-54-dependent Fis family transcriptional regulator [Raoultella]|uniref:Acetoin catabolism regulatory protein n=2 Tax=Raoultella terrigena TaxID=577 RepID=A0A485CAN8_RAOTE|nr:sigma-54-dependent Fis family transcriptional regulator [Raoultella terrigena]AJF74519.1 ATPase AAA [Raoultella ornithinolytica]MCE9900778.1 sigma-54-dependent Fis family transcriptional regulator [Raoultella terrigena]MEB7601838.1 sigma-54-dependent Fis family transcriptional regulator [Raoultella terrigena]NWK89423.1 sigma-54-dependent Fis family transcriptional regulator [Raoultella terrigena]QIT27504.1 sigma-54-dependent Fis family transcriptional regulator [Raoultella terrigena]